MKWVLLLLGLVRVCQAQTFDEWFEQNKTRKQYNEAQISALQTYIGVAEKGWALMESGLGAIKEIKSGEFSLHGSFYASLLAINPAIAGMGEVADIIVLQAAMVTRFKNALAGYAGQADLVSEVGRVYQAMVSEGLADVNALIDLVTADRLQMTDDQRAAGVRALDERMRERYAVTQEVTGEADLLSMQRAWDSADRQAVLGLY